MFGAKGFSPNQSQPHLAVGLRNAVQRSYIWDSIARMRPMLSRMKDRVREVLASFPVRVGKRECTKFVFASQGA